LSAILISSCSSNSSRREPSSLSNIVSTCSHALKSIFSFGSSDRNFETAEEFYQDLGEQSLAFLRRRNIQPDDGHGPPELWSIDGPEFAQKSYERAMSEIIEKIGEGPSEDYFERFLSQRKSRGESTHVLDLFGSALFVSNRDNASSLTGLRWGPLDTSHRELLVEMTPEDVPPEVLGDIINHNTWLKLDQSMSQRNITSMDLITMRPEGGWQLADWSESPDKNIVALSYILSQAIPRMSPTGRMFFDLNTRQMPGDLSTHPMIVRLIDQIERFTNYRLIIQTKLSTAGTTYRLSGVVLPK
jgi:hypothetical protein